MQVACMMRWLSQRVPFHRVLRSPASAPFLPSSISPTRRYHAAMVERSPRSPYCSCYHQLLSSPKTLTTTSDAAKFIKHSRTPNSTMSQNTANRRLLECLALAQKKHESPRLENTTTTSNDCIDPRLLALPQDAAVQEENAHASSSTASETGSAVSQGKYLGSSSDDSALPESGLVFF
jgi:hypothetical protein